LAFLEICGFWQHRTDLKTIASTLASWAYMFVFLCAAAVGQGSMYSRVVPYPTGTNGYEEYLQAADIASGPEFDLYDTWLVGLRSGSLTNAEKPFDVDRTDPDLAVRRKWAERFRRCCSLISNGNRKPVSDPRGAAGAGGGFPEYRAFKSLAKIEEATAHVLFADGQTGDAIRHLEDGLIFGSKIGAARLMGRMQGIACDAIAFDELDDHWAQLCLSDAQELEVFFGRRLNSPPTLIESIPAQRRVSHAAVIQLFSDSADFARTWGLGENQQGLMASLNKLGPFDAEATQASTLAAVDGFYDSMIALLNGPESAWLSVREVDGGDQAQDASLPLGTRLAGLVAPIMSRVLVREAQDRTRMRLAYLTAKALEYRWLKGHLPDRIEDFTTAEERRDQTSGRAFRFKRDGPWFRITREGRDALGVVTLFQPPAPADPGSGPIRP